jgi:hypothetical protein
MLGVRYLTTFLVGAVVGIFNEFVQKPHQPCYQRPDLSSVLTCGAANVYGWSLVALTAYFDVCGRFRVPTALTLLMVGPLLAGIEASMGVVSQAYFKEQRWKYPDSYLPACGGTISLLSSLYFAAGGLLYYFALYKPLLSKI